MAADGDALADVIHTKLSLTHEHVLDIGEKIHEKQLVWIENEKRRAVKATEEVVKREEEDKYRKHLEKEREKFEQEKQQLLHDCKVEQDKALAKAIEELTIELKRIEEQRISEVREEDRANFDLELEEVRRLCENDKEVAVQLAREEEREIARVQAEEQEVIVASLREQDSAKAETDKQLALKELEEKLRGLHGEEVSRVISEEREKAAAQLRDHQDQHTEMVTKLNGTIWLSEKANKELQATLEEEREARNQLQEDYDNLKKEFADFVNHVPGFRDEFIIK